MKKRDFIQMAAAYFMPPTEWNVDKSIVYAEKLWDRLTAKGYGESKPHDPKAGVDYYRKLSPAMQVQFDKFWIAFAYKEGKQGAAMRWWQMGELSAEHCDKIIHAAGQTAAARKNLPPDRVPIMAQGWLNEMRFLDGEVTETEKKKMSKDNVLVAMTIFNGDLAHAKRMSEMGDPANREYWLGEVKKITEKIRALRENN
ncbi:MAG: hypothetical protein WAW36_01070 [Methylovulum miyakonense]|uniref:hypothetical protein n=1 Tax=Methylovulum miyakonense TaxID=645578 RepID=UPI003BB66F2A